MFGKKIQKVFNFLIILSVIPWGAGEVLAEIKIKFSGGRSFSLADDYSEKDTIYFNSSQLFNVLNINSIFDAALGRLTFDYGEHSIVLAVDAGALTIDGQIFNLGAPVLRREEKLLIPISFIRSVLGEMVAQEVDTEIFSNEPPVFGITRFDGALNDFMAPRRAIVFPRGPDREFIVVLDPGHGGDDSGAMSEDGKREKDIVLSVALKVFEKLENTEGLKLFMTRKGDYYITLRSRTEKANLLDADMFVSIHANAAKRKGATGIETFFLSANSTDAEARRTAQLENAVFEREDSVLRAGDDIKGILFDLSRNEAMKESSVFADSLQTELVSSLGVEDRGVKQAPFYVLMGVTIPAVLVEIGFMSNRDEVNKLVDNDYQERIAESIAQTIKAQIHRMRIKNSSHRE